jgi:hypothetical protein
MPREQKDWTLLAYVAGDNNLSRAGRADIEELAKVGVTKKVYAAAEFDARRDDGMGSIRYEFTEKEPLEPGNTDGPDPRGYTKIIQILDEKDSGDPKTFKEFLDWGFARYPATNILVVVWGHGHGFKDAFSKGVADDFESRSSLDMGELKLALETSLRASGRKNVTLLGFDSCLMSMLEICYELRDITPLIVGSQQTERAEGWPYQAVLGAMNEVPEPQKLGKQIGSAYIDFYNQHLYRNGTQSVVDTTKVADAMEAFGALGKTLHDNISTADMRNLVLAARDATRAFGASDYLDLIHFCQRLRDIPSLRTQAAAAEQAAKACIVESFHTDDMRDANGLSVWFPRWHEQYANYRDQYRQLAADRDYPAWSRFLDRFFALST